MEKQKESTMSNATPARRQAWWVAAGAVVAAWMCWNPGVATALGLGEMKLNSVRYQAFDAEIQLIDTNQFIATEESELKVSMASSDAFARYGLERPAYLDDFEFAVVPNRVGGMVIKVTSSSLVTEPVVNLLVNVESGRGRLMREYTAVFDTSVPRVTALGEIKCKSVQHQPFAAEIEVFPNTTQELSGQISLASSEQFAQRKLDRPAYLDDFKFAFGPNRDGRTVIKVTSSSAVHAEAVVMLVSVETVRGRLLREYTVLLDPDLIAPRRANRD